MKLFDELPSVLPWFDTEQKQIRFRENNSKVEIYKLISGDDNLLPFLIKLPKDTPAPIEWKIYQLNGIAIDISNNIGLLKAVNFSDATYAYYKAERIFLSQNDLCKWFSQIFRGYVRGLLKLFKNRVLE